jgi:glucose/arabinose dehydrogenase
MVPRLLIISGLWAAAPSLAVAGAGSLFVSRPGQILKLVDQNQDGDFLDYAESGVYAESLPQDLGAIRGTAECLYVLVTSTAQIIAVQDRNGDGDALDYGETTLFAMLPGGSPPPVAAALACQGDGTLLVSDAAAGLLYHVRDLNHDGDALDADEVVPVAGSLANPTALAVRPDGKVLLAESLFAVPLRILIDRNADGDYFDFAENLSYVENLAPGQDLVAVEDRIAYLTRPSDGCVLRLFDGTADDDALDFGEVLTYAQGLTAPYAVTADAAGLFVACRDAAGTVYRVRDLNHDGDALDYGEVLPVAVGVHQPAGLVFVAGDECRKGDINGDGVINLDDLPLFLDVLLCITPASDPCPADLNDDGQIDGNDIHAFVDAVL